MSEKVTEEDIINLAYQFGITNSNWKKTLFEKKTTQACMNRCLYLFLNTKLKIAELLLKNWYL